MVNGRGYKRSAQKNDGGVQKASTKPHRPCRVYVPRFLCVLIAYEEQTYVRVREHCHDERYGSYYCNNSVGLGPKNSRQNDAADELYQQQTTKTESSCKQIALEIDGSQCPHLAQSLQ
jgi:hypothetical protein